MRAVTDGDLGLDVAFGSLPYRVNMLVEDEARMQR